MSGQLHIDRIWWRDVPAGEFYNVERHPDVTKRGQGALYFEIPSSVVPRTLDFLGLSSLESLPHTIQAGIAGEIGGGVSGPIEFRRKSKKSPRMLIARQNRQMSGTQRHPAWARSRGFPSAPDSVQNRGDAAPYFPEGGLRIYIAKTLRGDYFAGFTTGRRPADMDQNDPAWDLYSQGSARGGVIHASGGSE